MDTDLRDRQPTPDSDDKNPEQNYYNREFAGIVDPENYNKEATPGELSNQEQDAGFYNPAGDSTRSASGTGDTTGLTAAAGTAAGLATGGVGGIAARLLRGRLQSKKSKGAVGGLTAVIVLGGIFFAGISSGPLMLIHYAQILRLPFTHQTNASSSRLDKIIRWSNERDVGETRLGRAGSIINKSTIKAFADNGIELKTDRLTGQLKAVTLDTAVNHQYDGLSNSEKIAAFAKDNGIDISKVQQINGANPNGIKIGASLSDMKLPDKTNVLNNLVEQQHWDKLSAFTRLRVVKAYLNINNPWLHPIQASAAKADQKLADSVRAKAAQASEDSRLKALVAKSDATKAKIAGLRSKLSTTTKVTGGALLLAGAVCIAKDIAHSVPEINRLNVVEPAIESAADAGALGDEVENETAFGGQNVDASLVGAAVSNFTGLDGTTPFASSAIQSIATNTVNAAGVAVDPVLAAAFAASSSAKTIDADLNALGADALCSGVGQFVQIVGGTALLLTGVGGVADAGLKLGTTAAAGVAIGLLTSQVEKAIADKPLTGTPHQGAAGGSVDALGDIGLSNMSSQSQGGVVLSPTESAQLSASQNATEQQQFKSESFASRMFDTHDYRSLASRLIDSQKPSGVQNVASSMSSLFTGFTHISSVFSSLASALLPHAQAAAPTTPYGLGVQEIGFSQADLTNPLFDNPYTNAEAAAKLFDADAGDGSMTYVQKAAACFGMNIAKDATGDWGATAITHEGGVDPNSTDYDAANCNDQNTDWKRVRFFLLDTAVIEGYACGTLNDAESCADSGFGASETANTPANPTTPGTYKNPLRDIKNISPSRIDGGVDYGGDDGPIYAVGDGKVIRVDTGAASRWPGTPGAYILYQLSDGPASGKYIYTAEDCTPTVKVGDTVTPDTILCRYHFVSSAMELGWGDGHGEYVTNDYKSHGAGSYASNSGQDFSKFLTSLPTPAPPGKIQGTKSTQPMPAGWPTW